MIDRRALLASGVALLAGACSSPRAASARQPLSRIAFGSCAFQWEPQPIFRAIAATEPDLYLSLGDAIYGDYDGERVYDVTARSLRREWGRLTASPDWRYLVERVPVDGTWDNHDYGHYQAGAEFPLKRESQQLFLDFLGEPEGSERRATPGVYSARTYGTAGRRTQVILARHALLQRTAGARRATRGREREPGQVRATDGCACPAAR